MKLEIEYEWEPFSVDQICYMHSTHFNIRLNRDSCSHWGPAIYKWEGAINQSGHEHNGKTGLLIGETQDLRARLKQYATGTQPNGNLWWRKNFLECGQIGFYILKIHRLLINNRLEHPQLDRKNWRLVLEQILVLEAVRDATPWQWVVNKMQ